MINVEMITIKEFRGIRDLTLQFNGSNFAVCWPNGTGKSGIVDALEFAVTGNVSRLSGEGRGDISLKEHAPHVDSCNNPERAQVSVTLTIPTLKKKFTITRTVDAAASPVIEPRDPVNVALVRILELHPEIVLSRRDLIRYVLATPGQRAEEVQALLHLDKVAKVRAILFKIANSAKKLRETCDANANTGRTNLLAALGIDQFKNEQIIRATNAQRQVLQLPPLAELTDSTSLRGGVVAPTAAQGSRLVKAQALQEITLARELLAEFASPASNKCIADARDRMVILFLPILRQTLQAEAQTSGSRIGQAVPIGQNH
jgi:DNA repair exonuclease SbcCD ATPase subunit